MIQLITLNINSVNRFLKNLVFTDNAGLRYDRTDHGQGSALAVPGVVTMGARGRGASTF